MDSLTHFQRDLLTVLCGMEDPHGLAIKDELEQLYGDEVNHGRLYPNLDHLVNAGFVEKGEVDRRTNCYAITPDGESWLRERTAWEQQYTERDCDEKSA